MHHVLHGGVDEKWSANGALGYMASGQARQEEGERHVGLPADGKDVNIQGIAPNSHHLQPTDRGRHVPVLSCVNLAL